MTEKEIANYRSNVEESILLQVLNASNKIRDGKTDGGTYDICMMLYNEWKKRLDANI